MKGSTMQSSTNFPKQQVGLPSAAVRVLRAVSAAVHVRHVKRAALHAVLPLFAPAVVARIGLTLGACMHACLFAVLAAAVNTQAATTPSYNELQKECKRLGIRAVGNSADMQKRIHDTLATAGAGAGTGNASTMRGIASSTSAAGGASGGGAGGGGAHSDSFSRDAAQGRVSAQHQQPYAEQPPKRRRDDALTFDTDDFTTAYPGDAWSMHGIASNPESRVSQAFLRGPAGPPGMYAYPGPIMVAAPTQGRVPAHHQQPYVHQPYVHQQLYMNPNFPMQFGPAGSYSPPVPFAQLQPQLP